MKGSGKGRGFSWRLPKPSIRLSWEGGEKKNPSKKEGVEEKNTLEPKKSHPIRFSSYLMSEGFVQFVKGVAKLTGDNSILEKYEALTKKVSSLELISAHNTGHIFNENTEIREFRALLYKAFKRYLRGRSPDEQEEAKSFYGKLAKKRDSANERIFGKNSGEGRGI
ncbi:MAG: hypothetical protein ABID38_06925 [Candidatus Diapherotrites archaeon]